MTIKKKINNKNRKATLKSCDFNLEKKLGIQI